MDDVKLIYTNGDSWTAGDIIDPKKFGEQFQYVMHPDNDEYRLPKVWPHKLGVLLGKQVLNKAVAGSSNDTIVRNTLNDVLELLKVYRPEELYVIIGWSSPERKDFFLKKDDEIHGHFECIYPAELDHFQSVLDDINQFHKLYVTRFWHEEEYITRHCINTITVHNFFKSLGIKHMFFNAFYEGKAEVFDQDYNRIFHNNTVESFIEEFQTTSKPEYLKRLHINNLLDEYQNIFKETFHHQSFISYIMEVQGNLGIGDYLKFHPTELGHEVWSKKLYKELS